VDRATFGKAEEFGELMAFARALEFGSKQDYGVLKNGLQRLVGNQSEPLNLRRCFLLSYTFSPLTSLTAVASSCPSHPRLSPESPPVSRGQLIYVKLLSRIALMVTQHRSQIPLIGKPITPWNKVGNEVACGRA
jgi:hypothetical protein